MTTVGRSGRRPEIAFAARPVPQVVRPMRRRLNGKLLVYLSGGVILFGVAIHLIHGVQVKRNAKTLLGQADRAEKDGNPEEVADYLGRYLIYQPRDADALGRYGRLIQDQGKTPIARYPAIQVYEKVLRIDPTRREIRRRVVDLAMDPVIREYSDAQTHLEVLLKSSDEGGEKGELEYLLGRCKEGLGKPEEALAHYEEARKLAPGRIESYARIAELLRSGTVGTSDRDRADRVMDAREVKDGLISANGRSAPAYLARAAYRRKYNLPGAPDDLTRALELAPDEPDVLLWAAAAARERNDLDRARALLKHGTNRHPDNVQLRGSLAELERRAGHLDEAIEGMKRAIALAPDVLGLQWSQVESLIDADRIEGPEGAVAAIQALKAKKVRPELLGYLEARVAAHQSDWPKVARILTEHLPALEAQTEGRGMDLTKRALIMLGQSYRELGNAEAAQDAYRRAVSIDLDPDPMWSAARLGLVATLASQNKIEEALTQTRLFLRTGRAPWAGEYLARLLIFRNLRLPAAERRWDEVDQALVELERSSPDSRELPLLRAEALAGRSQFGPARVLLEKAREKQPDRVDIWIALANITAAGDKPAAGLAVLDEAGRRLGDRVELRLARADLLVRGGGEMVPAALEGLERGVEKFTAAEQSRLSRGLATSYIRAGADGQADRLWARLAEENPNDLGLRCVQFERALQAKSEGVARKILGQIRAIEGEGGVFWRFGEAILLTRQFRASPGDHRPLAEARRLLNYIAGRRPTWSRVLIAQAEIDELDGDPEGAIQDYLRAVLELGERSPQAIRQAVQLLYDRNRYTQAALVFQKLREDRTPISGELLQLDAEISMRTQDVGRALELAEKTASERSDDYRELLWLGQVRAAAGRPAEPVFRRAVALAGDKPLAWLALVGYLVDSKQPEKAESATREAESKLLGDQAALALAQCNEWVGRAVPKGEPYLKRAADLYQTALKSRPDDAPTLRNAAEFLLRGNRIEEAKTCLRRIITLKGGTPAAEEATRILALVTASKGGYRDSQEALEILGVTTNGHGQAMSPGILRTRARVLANQPNRASRLDAIAILEGVIKRDAPMPDDLFLLTQLYELNGDWPSARLNHLKLLEAHPNDPSCLANYALALLRHDKLNEAQAYLTKLQQIAPRQPPTIEAEARMLTLQKKADKAIALLREYAQVNQDRLIPTALLLEKLGHADAAETMYRDVVARSRRPTDILILAGFLGRQGKIDKALDLYDEALRTCPPDLVSNAELRLLYGTKADGDLYKRADKLIGEAARKNPESVNIQFDQANLRILEGRYADAEAILRGIHERNPSISSPLNNLAWMFALKDGDKSRALPLITRAVELDGETPDILDTRALVHMEMGRVDLAVRDMENAIAVTPNAIKYFHLARAYLMNGKRDESLAALEKAKEMGLTLEGIHPLERSAFRKLTEEVRRQ